MLARQLSTAARAMLGWSQGKAAMAAGTSERTLWAYEHGRTKLAAETLAALCASYEKAGIRFIGRGTREPGLVLNMDIFEAPKPDRSPSVEPPSVEAVEAVEVVEVEAVEAVEVEAVEVEADVRDRIAIEGGE